ncbi:hypothetical protein [Enterobacter sp.]|uniref:hypothetical protein n=1 Tax=Enterobacter sp. TaxID=42895 RepID=UPI00296EF2BB|nr:hypothetical protein [Enterobacter sp.]
MASRINGISSTTTYINTQGAKLGKLFQNEIIKRSKLLSQKVQADLNNSVEKGAVSFTQRSVLFLYKKNGKNSVTATIMIKDQQAKYLYNILVQQKSIDKFIPTSLARLDRFGNISGLRRGLTNGKYKVVKSKYGKERLIDTSKKDTKKKTKRVIGLREEKRRKLIYDFYSEVDKGVRLIMSDIQGTFRIKRR